MRIEGGGVLKSFGNWYILQVQNVFNNYGQCVFFNGEGMIGIVGLVFSVKIFFQWIKYNDIDFFVGGIEMCF